MKKYAFPLAFALGAAALLWVAAMVARSHLLVLFMTAAIGLVYGMGALELRRYRQATQGLQEALDAVPENLSSLDEWLARVPASLQNPVRQRIESERAGLPGPTLTPYLVGLLVMLGMLGTFLGMVVTLHGAVFALEASASVQGMRAAFAEPIRGLGLAFGTSVAGVATSAMLGLMSSLSRRDRAQAAQSLDRLLGDRLRPFSLTHQRQESHRALQAQTQTLPLVVQQLQTLMAHMERQNEQLGERLRSQQEDFHREVRSTYTALAQSVDASLRSSLSQSVQLASESLRPIAESTLGELARQAQTVHERVLDSTRSQLQGLHQQFRQSTDGMADSWTAAMASQHEAQSQLVQAMAQQLAAFEQRFGTSAEQLIASVRHSQHEQQAQQASTDSQRLQLWQDALQNLSDTLHRQWQTTGQQTLAQQQHICDALAQSTTTIAAQVQAHTRQTLGEIAQLSQDHQELMRARAAAEAQWASQQSQHAQELAALLRTELSALRTQEAERGEAAVRQLAELQTAVVTHLGTLGAALEAPIARLIETASQAPQAAAEVIGQMRQEISASTARDNALLEERTRILQTLNTLLGAIDHASSEQRRVIDSLVAGSQATLAQATDTFQAQVADETRKLSDMAAQVNASAIDVASLGETFAFAVRSFNDTHKRLTEQLQQIEVALSKSMARSDEQLAYYVAQAREIIDLSIGSQKDVLQALQQKTRQEAV